MGAGIRLMRYHASLTWPRAFKLAAILRTPLYRRALRLRIAAATEHERVPFGSEFHTVLDVGANRGQFSLVACNRFPRATILCFEPLPTAHAKLRRLWRGQSRVTLYNVALGSHSSEQAIHVSRSDDSSSMLAITARQSHEFPGTEEVARLTVPTRRLDDLLTPDLLKRPCLLKIDVQGFELEVLRGVGALLDDVDEILVECSFTELYTGQPLADEVTCYLLTHGFRLGGVFSPVYGDRRRCLQADLLFSRAS